jgi:hypothetical protein
MIDPDDLLKYRPHFITERQLEKDYLQTVLLNEIYLDFSSDLVFKGGTALQKIYGLDRFSDDLDFTYNTATFDKTRMYNVLERVNQQYRFNIHEHVGENDSLTIELRNAHGPLFNRNNITHMIKLDISLREFTVLAPKLHYMLPIYPDIKQFSVYSMELDEILAEKVRAIYTRTKARDIYDLYFILDKGAGNFRKDLVNKKLSGYKIIFTYDSFIKRIKDVSEKLWKEELSSVLLNPPNYGAVVNYISKDIKRHKGN